MKVFDVVELVTDFPEYKLVKGERGTILEIYDDRYCEVEICDDQGRTIYLGTLPLNNLSVIWQSK